MMKKALIIPVFVSVLAFNSNVQAQVKIRNTNKTSDSLKVISANPNNLQVVQPASSNQQLQSAQYASTGTTTKYYSVDQTAFTCSWGTFEVRKLYAEGSYIYYTDATAGAPNLVAPVNLPHNAFITGMTVIFFDASASQDLQAILWQGGSSSGISGSYNIAQVQSNNSDGLITQTQTLNTRVNNETHSYYITVSPANGTHWLPNGELKIKRIIISYTESP